MPVVVSLARGVDPDYGLELLAVSGDRHFARCGPCVDGLDSGDVEYLMAGETERSDIFTRKELQGQHPHADQIRPVYPLERLDKHGTDSEQGRTLGRPVTR